MAAAAQASLTLSLQFAEALHRDVLKRRLIKRCVQQALAGCELRAAEITCRFVNEAEGRELNHVYRGKDYATNVLTFDYAHEPVVMADIVICSQVIEREAKEQGKALLAHYAHMLVHGVLHACGHDHVKAREAKRMEALEAQVLQGLGFENPYQ